MRIKIGLIFIALGAVLILGALSFFMYNQYEANTAEAASADLLPKLMAQIEQQSTAETDDSGEVMDSADEEAEDEEDGDLPEDYDPEETQPDESYAPMPTVKIDGYNYIGYLSIPDLNLELPVMSTWSYPKLKKAPCRYVGSPEQDNLIIMAHNYPKHFGSLKDLYNGDRVYFVDMEGVTHEYQVSYKEVLQPTDVETLVTGDADLTLFTCTYGGKTRVVVYCQRVPSEEIKFF